MKIKSFLFFISNLKPSSLYVRIEPNCFSVYNYFIYKIKQQQQQKRDTLETLIWFLGQSANIEIAK